MRKKLTTLTLLVGLLLGIVGCFDDKSNSIGRISPDEIESVWLNGINLPWIDFGQDFGGGSDSGPKIQEAFEKFHSAGINSVRIWIHCDGRRNPLFDEPGGRVIGLPDGFLDDFKTILDAAEKNGIKVMPALWSFDMVKDRSHEEFATAGVQNNLLMNDAYLDTYIDNALIPLIDACDTHPALFAWEICNEPEWMVENLNIPLDRVQRFHARIAAVIHQNGKKPVTTGSASIKWNSDKVSGAVANWWSDEAMQSVYSDKDAYLDFYQVHVYGWMLKNGFDPYLYTPEELGLDKPVMIGEAPGTNMVGEDAEGKEVIYTPLDMLRLAREKGYFGHYFWSYAAFDGHGDWQQIKQAVSEEQ